MKAENYKVELFDWPKMHKAVNSLGQKMGAYGQSFARLFEYFENSAFIFLKFCHIFRPFSFLTILIKAFIRLFISPLLKNT